MASNKITQNNYQEKNVDAIEVLLLRTTNYGQLLTTKIEEMKTSLTSEEARLKELLIKEREVCEKWKQKLYVHSENRYIRDYAEKIDNELNSINRFVFGFDEGCGSKINCSCKEMSGVFNAKLLKLQSTFKQIEDDLKIIRLRFPTKRTKSKHQNDNKDYRCAQCNPENREAVRAKLKTIREETKKQQIKLKKWIDKRKEYSFKFPRNEHDQMELDRQVMEILAKSKSKKENGKATNTDL